MGIASFPMYFWAPQPAGSSTVSACPFSFSGRSEVSAEPSSNTDGLRDHLDHVQRWNIDANATGETLYCLPQLAGKPLAICSCDLDSLSCCKPVGHRSNPAGPIIKID